MLESAFEWLFSVFQNGLKPRISHNTAEHFHQALTRLLIVFSWKQDTLYNKCDSEYLTFGTVIDVTSRFRLVDQYTILLWVIWPIFTH